MRLRTVAKRFVCGATAGLIGSAHVLAGAPSGVKLQGFETRFGPGQLGGVTRIVRYLVPQPDRSETDYLLLTQGDAAASEPEAVQVIGQGGEFVHLADTEGADCTLERVRISARAGGGAEVVYAARVFSGALKSYVISDPASMQVSVFRAGPARDPGDSSVVFRLAGPPRQSRPVCGLKDVESEMTRLSTVTETRR